MLSWWLAPSGFVRKLDIPQYQLRDHSVERDGVVLIVSQFLSEVFHHMLETMSGERRSESNILRGVVCGPAVGAANAVGSNSQLGESCGLGSGN